MNHYGKLINCIATGFSFSSRILTTLIMSCEPVCHQDIRVSVIYMFICCLLSCKSSCHSLTFEFISFSASKNDTCFLPDFKMVLSYKSCYHHHLMQMKSLPDFGVQMDTTVAVTDSKSFSLVVFFPTEHVVQQLPRLKGDLKSQSADCLSSFAFELFPTMVLFRDSFFFVIVTVVATKVHGKYHPGKPDDASDIIHPLVAPPTTGHSSWTGHPRAVESIPEPLLQSRQPQTGYSLPAYGRDHSSSPSRSQHDYRQVHHLPKANVHSSSPIKPQASTTSFLTRIIHSTPIRYASQESSPSRITVTGSRKTGKSTTNHNLHSSSSNAYPMQATSSFYSYVGADPGYGYGSGSESQGRIPDYSINPDYSRNPESSSYSANQRRYDYSSSQPHSSHIPDHHYGPPSPAHSYGQSSVPSHRHEHSPVHQPSHGQGSSSPYSYSGPDGYAYSGPHGKGHSRHYSSPDGNSHSSSYSHSYNN